MGRIAAILLLALPGLGARQSRAQPPDSTHVITRDELRATGRTTLTEALLVLFPGIDARRPGGGSPEHLLRPPTLRGLGADQLLVLIDGTRVHPGPLVNPDGATDRGTSGVDLGAIPLIAVERVEIFRVGSGGRFGSGAIAGVINLVLTGPARSELVAQTGMTAAGDGAGARVGGTHRLGWGPDGFLQASAELRAQGPTNRARPDLREQFFPGDPRNGDPGYGGRINDRLGDPATREGAATARFGKRLSESVAIQGSAGASWRRGESASLWRRPSEDATVRSLYPGGFRPEVVPTLTDRWAALRLRGRLGREAEAGGGPWRWDASAGYGAHTTRIEVRETANPSLGPLSPTRFFAGTLGTTQLTAELALRGSPGIGLAAPLALGVGAGIRSEGYRVGAGERDSYRYGAVPIQDGPRAGGIPPIGAEGFPGFTPGDSFHRRRDVVTGSAELGVGPLRRVRMAAAGHLAGYLGEDRVLGAMTFSARAEPVPGVALRGAAGTLYRAPSLAQLRFSRTLVPVESSVGFFDLIVPSDHPVGQALSVPPLRSERGSERTAGLGLRSGRGFLDADYYRIAVRHRITLAGRFAGPVLRGFLETRGHIGIDAVRFFANTADTETEGLEIRAGYDFAAGGFEVRLVAGLDHHRTRVTGVDSVGGFLGQFRSAFFPARERVRLEAGQPGDNGLLSLRMARGAWRADGHIRRYGAVRDFGPAPDGTLAQAFGARWLGDLELSYAGKGNTLVLTAGAQNLFNRYPDRNNQGDPSFEGNSYFGILPYNPISPFGFTGRILYLRVGWSR